MPSPRSLRKNRKAASPAVSMVIITAATVVLVLVSSIYALQVLMRQQATAEFETVKDSLMAFDDALRDIAWDREGSRAVRFTTNYGNMLLINGSKSYKISGPGLNEEFKTAVVKYQMPYDYGGYVDSGSGSPYLMGDESTVVSRLNDSLGQAILEFEPGQASITLNYRVRVSEEGPINVLSPSPHEVHYVDIFLIRMKCESSEIPSGDFNLVCKNIGLETKIYDEIGFGTDLSLTDPLISVSDGTMTDYVYLKDLGLTVNDSVILNLIFADVRVST